ASTGMPASAHACSVDCAMSSSAENSVSYPIPASPMPEITKSFIADLPFPVDMLSTTDGEEAQLVGQCRLHQTTGHLADGRHRDVARHDVRFRRLIRRDRLPYVRV